MAPMRRLDLAVVLLCFATVVAAADPDIGERAFAWSADVLNSDFRSDTLDLSGNVRVNQGPMSIEAHAATAADFRSDNSRWTFKDDVRIRTAQAELRSTSAIASFVKGQIAVARAEGSPAEFEQKSDVADRQVRGRAGVIEYDFTNGVVRLQDQVWFSNGKDEFRGDVVLYNVRDERVQINPGGSSGRVRGIIRPAPASGARGASAEAEGSSEKQRNGNGA